MRVPGIQENPGSGSGAGSGIQYFQRLINTPESRHCEKRSDESHEINWLENMGLLRSQ